MMGRAGGRAVFPARGLRALTRTLITCPAVSTPLAQERENAFSEPLEGLDP